MVARFALSPPHALADVGLRVRVAGGGGVAPQVVLPLHTDVPRREVVPDAGDVQVRLEVEEVLMQTRRDVLPDSRAVTLLGRQVEAGGQVAGGADGDLHGAVGVEVVVEDVVVVDEGDEGPQDQHGVGQPAVEGPGHAVGAVTPQRQLRVVFEQADGPREAPQSAVVGGEHLGVEVHGVRRTVLPFQHPAHARPEESGRVGEEEHAGHGSVSGVQNSDLLQADLVSDPLPAELHVEELEADGG